MPAGAPSLLCRLAFPWQDAQDALLPSDPKAVLSSVLSGSALPSAFDDILSPLPLYNEVTAQGLRPALLSSRAVFLSSSGGRSEVQPVILQLSMLY